MNNIKAKGILVVNVAINLGILGFFKYVDFMIGNINVTFGAHIPAMNLPLPIGISFYTFQVMSYVIDLYKGKVKVQKDLIAFGTYVALFPQLIAGPIVRFETIEEQLKKRHVDPEMFASGVRRFTIGMAKKVLLANNIGLLWESVMKMNPGDLPVATAWIGAVAFTLQIYFDFSGYSDMAIGLGKMFGFTFLENFNYPYISKSITEFWRRWHISLSSWFKEYVYIPLGGNRHGIKRQILNIFTVWALTGLWHGASWNFVIWGIYFAILLIIEKLILGRILQKLQKNFGILGNIVSGAYAMVLITISWVIFAIGDLNSVKEYMGSLMNLHNNGFANSNTWYLLSSNLTLLIICIIGSTDIPAKVWEKVYSVRLQNKPLVGSIIEDIGLLILFAISFAYIVASTYNPFLYFRF
ncbi:MBOAT family O-acyltransferase [Aminipila terrae]|uniref:MBOAT family O-acyltransferase n=1 Tax=Aminipila terrae TaxID=2697030 RepID=UPI002ED3C9FD